MDVVYVLLLADYVTPAGYFKKSRRTPVEIPRSVIDEYGLPSTATIVNSKGERITAENDFSGTTAGELLEKTRAEILPFLETMSKEGLIELREAELVRNQRQGKKVRKILLEDIQQAILKLEAKEKHEKQAAEEQAAADASGV